MPLLYHRLIITGSDNALLLVCRWFFSIDQNRDTWNYGLSNQKFIALKQNRTDNRVLSPFLYLYTKTTFRIFRSLLNLVFKGSNHFFLYSIDKYIFDANSKFSGHLKIKIQVWKVSWLLLNKLYLKYLKGGKTNGMGL